MTADTPAAVLPRVAPEEVGLSTARLARISAALKRRIERRELPGVVTLIARHGRIAHLEAQGFMDIASRVPMRADAIFRMASMTKPVTSVASLILHEEGHYFLDDPISC